MPSSSPNDLETARERLLDLCEELVRERGAVGFSLGELAGRARLPLPAVQRVFESQERLWEAMAGRWFAEMNEAMDRVVAMDLPPREKMVRFFCDRLAIKRARYEEDPELFETYCALGAEHFEAVRGYIDLADHLMAQIIGEAMADGWFQGYEIDEVVSQINLMVQPFCNPMVMLNLQSFATDEQCAVAVYILFAGLNRTAIEEARGAGGPVVRLAG